MRSQFGDGQVWRDPNERTNTILVGALGPPPADGLRAALPGLPSDLGVVVQNAASTVGAGPEGWTGLHR